MAMFGAQFYHNLFIFHLRGPVEQDYLETTTFFCSVFLPIRGHFSS